MEAEQNPPIVEEQLTTAETRRTEVQGEIAPKKDGKSEVNVNTQVEKEKAVPEVQEKTALQKENEPEVKVDTQVEKEIAVHTYIDLNIQKPEEEPHVNISTQPDETSIAYEESVKKSQKSPKSRKPEEAISLKSEGETQSIGMKSVKSFTQEGEIVIEIEPEPDTKVQDGTEFTSYDVTKLSEECGEEGEERVTITYESIAQLNRQKKKQRREEMRLARQQGLSIEGSMDVEVEKVKPTKRKLKSKILNRSFDSTILRSDDVEYADELEKFQMILDRTYDEQLLQELAELTTSEISSSSTTSTESVQIASCSVNQKNKFLENFDDLLSVSEVSSAATTSDDEDKQKIVEEDSEHCPSVGKYTNPLTGETESSSSSSSIEAAGPAIEDIEDPTVCEEQEIEIDLPVDMSEWDKISVVGPIKSLNEADEAIALLQNIDSNLFDFEVVSHTDLNQERLARAIRKVVIDLLLRLFDEVTDFVEYIDPKVILARNLNKSALLNELKTATDTYIEVKYMNTTLNTKVFEFYRRQKSLRSITKQEPNVEERERLRYKENLDRLDHFKRIAKAATKQNSDLMASVMMDLQYHLILSQKTAVDCERKIRSLVRKDSEFLQRIVDRDMIAMDRMRDEIADLKLFIINRQHTLARLDERIAKYENITKDLTLDKFLRMQREVQIKGKTLEERTNDLKRMHVKFDNEIHMLSHIREKSEMLRAQLESDRKNLRDKIIIKDALRSQLLQEKKEHGYIQVKTKDVYYKGGLLFKPALMFDFDVTMETVKIKRAAVNKLKETMSQLEQRIIDIEKRRTTHKSSIKRRRTTSATVTEEKRPSNSGLPEKNKSVKPGKKSISESVVVTRIEV